MADAVETIRQELEAIETRAAKLRAALEALEGTGIFIGGSRTGTVSREYDGLGIVDATKRFLAEVGEPRTTSEIKDALMNRGWTTRSKNATATIYATLDNSHQFKRTEDGRWEILRGDSARKGR